VRRVTNLTARAAPYGVLDQFIKLDKIACLSFLFLDAFLYLIATTVQAKTGSGEYHSTVTVRVKVSSGGLFCSHGRTYDRISFPSPFFLA
jgi:hypothetical protein